MMNRRILVVDDEKHMVSMLKKALKEKDTDVETAGDGEEALLFCEKNEIDLVITDISMPKMQGTELFHKIRKMNPFIQIIMITAYPTLENIANMLEVGASDFVIKPFDIDYLIDIVDQTFERIDR